MLTELLLHLHTLLHWLLLAAAASLLLLASVRVWYDGLTSFAVDTVRRVPSLRRLIVASLRRQVRRLVREDFGVKAEAPRVCIPEKGEDPQQLSEQIRQLKTPQTERMFAYVYTEAAEVLGRSLLQLQQEAALDFLQESDEACGEAQRQLARQYMEAFMHENALNPGLFKALRRFEVELVQMTAGMLHAGREARGNVTCGGTESLLMAVKAYRDLARERRPGIVRPNIVAAVTVHPAVNKAAHYFGLEMVLVPVDPDTLVADPRDLRQAVDANTVLLVASAPQYCHGIVDPVPQYGELAMELGLPLHVDACFGGFMLPWVDKLGYPVPQFDFRVEGVTSVSADLHKYGFAPKGASVIVYRSGDLRKHQLFAYSRWPGGLFGSPTMAGTRPGGYLAASWVTLRAMGQDGYMRIAQQLMELTRFWIDSINATGTLRVLGSPQMTCFAIGAVSGSGVDIFVLADIMEEKGWKMEREMNPDCLHVTVMPHHLPQKQQLIDDLTDSVNKILSEGRQASGMGAIYGMVARVPAKSLIDEFLLEFFNEIYS